MTYTVYEIYKSKSGNITDYDLISTGSADNAINYARDMEMYKESDSFKYEIRYNEDFERGTYKILAF